ncbi:MAG: M20/M25/M40 family metallo-hydrolase [Thermoleophilia bacterium]|nr:M20/M25/M40 family metallo-hydrolase [Thermoleophilia bacterium]
MALPGLRDEATELLRELIRLDTVNPPGNETRAADLLVAYLEDAGVECETYARAPERANLVARIPGRGDGKRLLLLSHTDTVLADPAEWSVDPWSGELRDDCVWGRGALDMKGHVAAAAVAVATLARERFRPAGDLVFAATADEEVGTSDFGLSWLCRAHPDAVRAEYCVNEGGGDRVVVGGRAFYLCAVAEKMSSPFRLRVHGRSGHASMPGIADNALVKAARITVRLAEYSPPPSLLPETEDFFSTVLGHVPDAARLAAGLRELPQDLAAMVEPMLSITVSPTMLTASRKRNVVPGVCELVCDCRLLPGDTQSEAEAAIRAWLGEDGYELSWIEGVGGTRSSRHTPLWEEIERWVAGEERGAGVAPVVLPGFTDSHYLREAFGTIAYGFFPLRTMSPEVAARLVHSADERIAVDDLELGTRFLRHVARAVCAGA